MVPMALVASKALPLIKVFFQGFWIVSCTAMNVRLISRGTWIPAHATGFLISWIWWGNTRAANRVEGRLARFFYALGSAWGTTFGMWLGGIL